MTLCIISLTAAPVLMWVFTALFRKIEHIGDIRRKNGE